MRLEFQGKLFFGIKVDAKAREHLATASAGNKSFFEGPNATLTLCVGGADTYIGKIVDGGIGSDELEDMVRHVLSVLDRVAPDRGRRTMVKLFVCTESGLPPPTLTPPPSQEPPPDKY
ncbi:MAG: hypothetical protein HY906_02510 [Deltaproteobacteria bacterium]|nr:hypothetical protein [Deltaproteobacteria bacterium]